MYLDVAAVATMNSPGLQRTMFLPTEGGACDENQVSDGGGKRPDSRFTGLPGANEALGLPLQI